MAVSLFFDLTDILATEERVNAEFKLDCFNLDSLDYLSVRLDTDHSQNENQIQGEPQDSE